MAGVGNGLFSALIWFLLVYALFLVASAALGVASFVRGRVRESSGGLQAHA